MMEREKNSSVVYLSWNTIQAPIITDALVVFMLYLRSPPAGAGV